LFTVRRDNFVTPYERDPEIITTHQVMFVANAIPIERSEANKIRALSIPPQQMI
jgi:hypothetical protein